MTKYLLPFLLFVSVGLSQDRTAKKLAAILQGADRNVVAWGVHDLFDDVGKALEDSLETKLKLGMKRNKAFAVG